MSDDVVTITGIAAGGDGVGRLADGRAVFVPRTAPGDRVTLDPGRLERRRSFARGAVADVQEPSADRVTPVCPHYERDRCGGCQLQHLAYPAQLAAKQRIVGDTLRRIGKLDVGDPAIDAAPAPWRYSARVALAAHRGAIGYHPHDAPGRVFDLEDCHIADERLMALWRAVSARRGGLPERLTRLTLRLDRDGRQHVIAESSGAPWRDPAGWRAALPDAANVVCWWQPADGAARVVAGPETGFPTTAFEQVHPTMGVRAREFAVAALGDVRGQAVWDLYGGVGDSARLLATGGANVTSVDADERAVAWGRAHPVPEAPPIRWVASRAEDIVGRLEAPAAVIANPPRAGLHWDVTLRLTGDPAPRLVYLSCDPATLARDLARLAAVYRVADVRAFDLFPQTAHVETVAVLEAA